MTKEDRFDIVSRRAEAKERMRVDDLMGLTPAGERVLEIGARDCFLSRKLTALYTEVTALDLCLPCVDEAGIVPVKGDVTALNFADASFDTVFCTEVLEHIPPAKLQTACDEIARVTCRYAVIGVPYRQDLRANRTRCARCGEVNPTTGHLNCFDRERLFSLFAGMTPLTVHLVGDRAPVTNPVSVFLYRLCGYPYGSYDQEEACVYCGARLERPRIGPLKWAVCFVARTLNALQHRLTFRRRPIWIHILFEKKI